MRAVALALAVLVALPAAAGAQDTRARLLAAGAPAEFADAVAAAVLRARAEGLPVAPLEAKAIEGWAKRDRVPVTRVLAFLEDLRGRLAAGRDIARQTGLASPSDAVVSAAAEALGRGLTSDQVGNVIRAAPAPEAATAGLRVAAALAAQGLDAAAAVRAVQRAYRDGASAEQLFELPSVVADLLARGVPLPDLARRILEGGGLPLPAAAGGAATTRPSGVPPAREPGTSRTPGTSGRPG